MVARPSVDQHRLVRKQVVELIGLGTIGAEQLRLGADMIERIEASTDVAELERWLAATTLARSMKEVFGARWVEVLKPLRSMSRLIACRCSRVRTGWMASPLVA